MSVENAAIESVRVGESLRPSALADTHDSMLLRMQDTTLEITTTSAFRTHSNQDIIKQIQPYLC